MHTRVVVAHRAIVLGAAGLLVFLSGQPSASALQNRQKHAPASPGLTLAIAGRAFSGGQLEVTGKVNGNHKHARVALQRRTARGWVLLTNISIRHGRFRVRFRAPAVSKTLTLSIRIALIRGGRVIAVSPVRSVRVRPKRGGQLGVLGSAFSAKALTTVDPTPAAPIEPGPSELTATTSTVTLVVGSVASVNLPASMSSVTTIEGPSAGGAPGVSVAVEGSGLTVSASAEATAGSSTLMVSGTGCTISGCSEQFMLRIPVLVEPLAPPSGAIEAFPEPSSDRIAAAVNHDLVDELVVTVGSPEAPGTRAQAEAAASAAEGVIAGGLEASGIYQIRWATPQDLTARTEFLETQPAVTSVSPSSVGLYGPASAYPVAHEFDETKWTWPFAQVHATQAWTMSSGSDVAVGIIDEGNAYAAHEDLNVIETIGNYQPEFHATHVAGLACAKNNAIGMVGMGWGCPIVSARIGSGDFTLAVLNAMHAMSKRPRVKVVNVSLGSFPNGGGCAGLGFQQTLAAALAKEKGIFTQFFGGPEGQKIVWTLSAGNNCAPGPASPWGANSQLPNVVTVAATNSDETLAVFSNFGPGVEVAAPGGVSIEPESYGLMSTAIENDCPAWGHCPVYCFWTISYCGSYKEDIGTSMSAPIVAGIAALVRSKNPALSADEAGTCITSAAGTAGVGEASVRSGLPHNQYFADKPSPDLPFTGSIPIVNAAAAVECAPRGTASSYAGSGGGDGWAVALTQSAVYNVFHHSTVLQVACHYQADASPCWEPETITDADGDNFATSGHPGLWLDQSTGRLYVFATRTPDQAAGVVCIDTFKAPSNPNPFCGFTPLSGAGEASPGISGVSDPAQVGSRWYAFNYVNGSEIVGKKNKLLCFDLNTFSSCPGQPFSVANQAGSDEDYEYPPPAVVAIGARVIIPLRFQGTDELACFEGNTETTCSGAWPVQLTASYNSFFGPAFPILDSSGEASGLCLPNGADACYGLDGLPVSTPPGMTDAIPASSGWNGPALTRGTRVYVPNGIYDQVDCYDYGTSASCTNFPRSFSGLSLLYTVNRDPERPHCIWVNSDNGEGQIQNFDADTGGTCE